MNPTYESLANSHGCWERCDVRSGGLQEWALLEICAENFLRPAASVRFTDQRSVKVRLLGPKTGPARQRLTHEEAVAIYLARLGPKSCKTAARMAAEFGITAKAVRDVWTGKTWAEQTRCVRTVQRANDYIPPSASSAVAVARVQRALSRVHPPKRVACQWTLTLAEQKWFCKRLKLSKFLQPGTPSMSCGCFPNSNQYLLCQSTPWRPLGVFVVFVNKESYQRRPRWNTMSNVWTPSPRCDWGRVQALKKPAWIVDLPVHLDLHTQLCRQPQLSKFLLVIYHFTTTFSYSHTGSLRHMETGT